MLSVVWRYAPFDRSSCRAAATAAAKGSKSPTFAYTDGLTDPVGVTTDANGNVYVANFALHGPGPVVEYAHGKNVAIENCDSGLSNTGIAVDAHGNVFVIDNNPCDAGRLVEYKHGLKGCRATTLGVQFSFAGGLKIDATGTLVACDQPVGVDIVLFIAAPNGHHVLVDRYPSGTPVNVLASKSGLVKPMGVATFSYL